MSSVGYYRSEAERCRALAAKSPDSTMAQQWLKIAAEYEALAAALGAASFSSIPAPMQHQPMQQQQSKSDKDKT
jgi:hypothetical protein